MSPVSHTLFVLARLFNTRRRKPYLQRFVWKRRRGVVPRRQSHCRSGLVTLPSVGA